jgi:hypothetical protein
MCRLDTVLRVMLYIANGPGHLADSCRIPSSQQPDAVLLASGPDFTARSSR